MVGTAAYERPAPGAHVDPASGIASEMRRFFGHNQVVELRAPKTRHGTVSGYFDQPERFAAAAAQLSGQVPAVYLTPNPAVPALLARAYNRTVVRAEQTTSDHDIAHRRWLLIDNDPVRPAGISSTEVEHDAALTRTRALATWLRERGFQDLIVADSGNGGHCMVPINLPNDAASTALIKRCLEALALYFTDQTVMVDLTTFNPARIWKVYGTLACKGDSTPDRPHRVACILEAPESFTPTPRELLEHLAALAPEEPPRQHARYTSHGTGTFDIEQWIAKHNLNVVGPRSWQGGRKWIFTTCPWNADHTNSAAFIVQLANGAIAAGCHHNGCTGKGWHDLRDTTEPGWREWGNNGKSQWSEAPRREAAEQEDTQPFSPGGQEEQGAWLSLAPEALHGLAGDVVRAIDPYTEADQVAVLINLLAMFGNAIAANAHFLVEFTKHFPRLFVVLVGETAKGRKGQSFSTLRHVFEQVDLAWVTDCITGGLSSGEGLLYQVRDPRYALKDGQQVCVDEGATDKRLFLLEEEFAGVLKVAARQGNTVSAIMRQGWDKGDLRSMVKNNPIRATGAHISILAHITKNELLRHLTETEQSNGYANRFLWLLVKRSKLIPRPRGVPQEDLQPLIVRLQDAVTIARKTSVMDRDAEAEKVWETVYPELPKEKPGLFGATIGRAEVQVMRLACIYALLNCSAVVRKVHLAAALALWDYAEESARLIFGDALGDPVADDILSTLRRSPEGLTRTDIRDFFGRNRKSSEVDRALGMLLKAGYARKITERPTGEDGEESKGRPIERWYVCTT